MEKQQRPSSPTLEPVPQKGRIWNAISRVSAGLSRSVAAVAAIGAVAGVVFFHPVAMVIEHLAGTHAGSQHTLSHHVGAADHLLMAFSVQHFPMALYYAVLFAVIGGALGGVMQQMRKKARRISELELLLPICANCKLLRIDDEWVTVEEYYSTTQGTEFSHGICPSCVRELYPNWKPSPDSAAKKVSNM